MDPTYAFRKALLRRILDIVGVAALATPAIAVGCRAKVVVDLDNGSGGSGGATGSGGSTTGIVNGTGDSSSSGPCTLTTTGGSGTGIMQLTECFLPPEGDCPNQYQAVMFIVPSPPCVYLKSVECGPVPDGNKCCYVVTEVQQPKPCGMGRPFTAGGETITAWAELCERGWSENDVEPSTWDLDKTSRAALADAWTADALLEHASVASFSRFALQLLAVGAPAELIAAAHRAALDEVQHARLCFALAGAYRGAAVSPSRFPFDGGVAVEGDLASVAAATAREGCIGETLSALIAAEQLAQATDPAVRRVLAVIAEDEARHAELAWRAVAWALEQGDGAVRSAVLEVFGNAARHLPSSSGAPAGLDAEIAAAHGRLDLDSSRQAVVRALAEVILPCANALLARTGDARATRAASPVEAEVGPATRRSPC